MTTEQKIGLISTLLTLFASAVAWLVKRQAVKRDEVEKEQREQDKQEQVERIANAPALQEIVTKHVETLMTVQNQRIEQLIKENNDQRSRHTEDRRSWETERKQEREEWQRQVLEWEVAKRSWEAERERFRKIIDELREELAPYRRNPARRERKGDEGHG